MGGRSRTTRGYVAAAIAALVMVGVPVPVGADPPSDRGGHRTFVATFDSWPEGPLGESFTNGGIRFFGLDIRYPGQPVIGSFAAEWVGYGLTGREGFSPPNALGEVVVLGPEYGFGRFGEFRMSIGRRARHATLGFFDAGITPGNVATLEAIRRGRVVARDSVAVDATPEAHHVLQIRRSRFDELRFTVTGDLENGVVFALFDDILIAS